MGRPPCCDKSNVKRGLWTAEEDAKILAHVSKHGTGNWTLVPKKAGLNRCGKSCRLRWTNYLRPDLNHDDFTPQEEDHIINLHRAIGSRWSLIARQLPGRTDNDVKNYWNTKLRKKLSKMGIDPVTHKPISQLLSEFGSVGGLPIAGHRVTPALETVSIPAGFSSEQFQDYSSFSRVEFLSQFPPNNGQESIPQPLFFNEVTSSSSSTSSSHEPQAPAVPSSVLWSDFLVQEPSQHEQVDDLQAALSQTKISGKNSMHRSDQHREGPEGAEFGSINAGDLGSAILVDRKENQPEISSKNSFVDTILDRDSELRSMFPDFLDGSLEYY